MDEFTKTEMHRIDELYGTDFKGEISTDDVKLIQRYEQMKAKQDLKFKAEVEAMQAESQARIDEVRQTEQLARDILTAKAKASRERWERLRNGQEEQK